MRSLLKPSPETTLNDSLSLALWFAARGSGRLICNRNCLSEPQCSTYRSPARVSIFISLLLTWFKYSLADSVNLSIHPQIIVLGIRLKSPI